MAKGTMRKKIPTRTTGRPAERPRPRGATKPQHNVRTADNDNLSRGLADLVPDAMRGTPKFLDVIEWNVEWFGAQKSAELDKTRFGVVVDILEALNGDLFIFEEVAGPSYDGRYRGAMDAVAEELNRRGAGDYVVFYTQAGGEQRVAMMWDRRWLRAKTDVKELFPVGTHKTQDGKDAFAQRTPLYGYFTARVPEPETDPRRPAESPPLPGEDRFDFQVLGVHLKAMTEGAPQRLESAKVLAQWLQQDAPKIDADVMIMGDWNAPPDDDCWKPIHDLEAQNKLAFTAINDPSDFSYLWLANRAENYVSRIDLQVISLASMQEVVGKAAQVVRWKPIEQAIAEAGSLTDKRVAEIMKYLKDQISDHLPTVSRFYFKT